MDCCRMPYKIKLSPSAENTEFRSNHHKILIVKSTGGADKAATTNSVTPKSKPEMPQEDVPPVTGASKCSYIIIELCQRRRILSILSTV